MTSADLDTRCLFPAHREVLYCVSCQQPQARWRISHAKYGEGRQPLCALCFLNTTGWLEIHRKQFDVVVNTLGLRRGEALERDADGRLVRLKDADDVLGAVVLHDRVAAVETLKKLFQRGVE